MQIGQIGRVGRVGLSPATGTKGQSFDLRTVIDPSDWAANATYADTYNTTITLPGDVKMLGNIWIDDDMVQQVASEAAAGGTLNRAYVSDWTAASATLVLHCATDPRSDGKTYRYSSQRYAVNDTENDVVVRNVSAIGNGHQDGAIRLTGTGARVSGGTIRDVPRHGMLVGVNAVLDGVTFIRGRNDMEGSGASNSVVCNQADITLGTFTVRNSTFDGSDGAGFTGPYAHGSTYDTLLVSATMENNTYRRMLQAHEACAQDMQVTGAILDDVATVISGNRTNSVTTVTSATGTADRMVEMVLAGDFISSDNTITCEALAAGFYRSQVSTADCDLAIDGDSITFTAEALFSNPSYPIFWTRGAVTLSNSQFGPAVGCPIDQFCRIGVGQIGSLAANNNTYPLGASFEVNGTTYNTLSALQVAGFDTGSVEASIPTAFFSDDFNRANGNLDGSTGWTRIGGSANQLTISSNELAASGSTQTLYQTGDIGSANHYVKATVKGAGTAGPLIVARAADQSNFVGIRWSSTGYQFQACIAGSFTTDSAVAGITPGAGDQVMLAVRGNTAFGYLLASGSTTWRRMFIRDLSSISGYAGLALNTKAGLVTRNATQSPWIDNFACGAI